MAVFNRVASRFDRKKEEYRHRPGLEGATTRAIESRTSKIPSVVFLNLAIGSVLASAALASFKSREAGIFVGLWAPTFLLLGIYNKLVKISG